MGGVLAESGAGDNWDPHLEEGLDYDFRRRLSCVLGLPIDRSDLSQAETVMRTAVDQSSQIVLSTPNVNWVVAARDDPDFRRAAIDNELCTADGMPLVWAARLLGLSFYERVCGSSLIEQLLHREGDRRLSIFLFGGEEGVAEQACKRINALGGGLEAVGHLYPGHGSVEDMSRPEIIAAINETSPDLLLVAVGARKGQVWIEQNRHRLNARVIGHLGATLNFLAGTINRAPLWVQRSGLEWLWRIVQEPKLFTRYARDGMKLGWLLATRLVPYWVLLRIRRRAEEGDPELAVYLEDSASGLRVTLSGTATHQTTEAVKPALREAVLADRDVVVDLAEVDYIDNAFIALLIIVAKHTAQRDKKLRLQRLSPHVKRLFRYNCAEFLLAQDGVAAGY